MNADADAVVVGGGPAGSVTAAVLAGRGFDVVLLDRASFPRTKPCGESVNPGAVRELSALGLLDAVRALPHETIGRWRISPVAGPTFEARFAADDRGIAIDRGSFDGCLLDFARSAGARVRTGDRVVDVIVGPGGAGGVVTSDGDRVRARLVVGADGLRSVVVRRLGLLRRAPKLRKVALTAHVEAPESPHGTGVICLTTWGCIGIAPLGGARANVVVVLDRDAIGRLQGEPAKCFDDLLATNAYLKGARRLSEVMVTGPFDAPTRSVVSDGVILVGDAAGYFDPLTGQGIYRALRGARIAADTVTGPLRAGRLGRRDLAAYERLHRRAFASGERLQRAIEAGVARPRLFAAAASLLRARPSLANRVLAVIGDLHPPLGKTPAAPIPADEVNRDGSPRGTRRTGEDAVGSRKL